jgi:hypothetical protein
MTSSSRRKRRTTRRSTPSRSDLRAAAALAAWLLLALPGRGEDWRLFLKAPPEPRTVAAVIAEAEEAVGPAAGPLEPDATPAVEVAAEPAVLGPVAAAPALPCDSCPATAALVAAAEETGSCAEDAAECREALEKLRADALPGIDLDIRVGGRPGSDYPCECRLEGETFQPRRFAATMFTWKAAGYCHKPLYFEHWNLERYGHSHGFVADSFLSAAHFFVTLPVLPYKMGVELPWECVYPLGYYRPGNCAPWTVPAVPVSCRGLAVEAATITGIVFLLP